MTQNRGTLAPEVFNYVRNTFTNPYPNSYDSYPPNQQYNPSNNFQPNPQQPNQPNPQQTNQTNPQPNQQLTQQNKPITSGSQVKPSGNNQTNINQRFQTYTDQQMNKNEYKYNFFSVVDEPWNRCCEVGKCGSFPSNECFARDHVTHNWI